MHIQKPWRKHPSARVNNLIGLLCLVGGDGAEAGYAIFHDQSISFVGLCLTITINDPRIANPLPHGAPFYGPGQPRMRADYL